MKMKILCAVAAMTLSQPLVAATAPPSFAGVQLGAAVDFPECEQKELSFTPAPGSGPFYKPDQSKICIEILDKNDVFLIFPKGQEPEISRNTSLNLTVIDGKVEGIKMFTIDHNYYQQVVGSLTAKFGKPSSVTRDEVEVAGIAVPSRDFVWARPGYHVDYEVINDMESGVVVVETDKAVASRKQNEAAESAKQTKL